MSDTQTTDQPQVGSDDLVRPFEAGQIVDYRNHVMGYSIFPLGIVGVTGKTVTATSKEGQTFHFHAETGIATWSKNLSIRHWPNAVSEGPAA